MINTKSNINIGKYKNPEYSLNSRSIGDKTDVRLNKKELAKPKHWILFSAATIAGIAFVAYNLNQRF